MFPIRSSSNTRGARRLAMETLESRNLLAVGVLLFPEEGMSLQTGQAGVLPVEVSPPDIGNEGTAPQLEVTLTSMAEIPVTDIAGSYLVDGDLMVLGRGINGKAVIYQQGTGLVTLENLSSLTGDSEGAGFAFSLASVGSEMVIVGQSKQSGSPSLFATVWDSDGNPQRPSVPTEGAFQGGVVHTIVASGFMAGDLGATPVVWTPDGNIHLLPLPDDEGEGAFGGTSFAMTEDGRILVGAIDGRAAVWEAVGDPHDGEYVLKQYAFDAITPFTLEPGADGFAPWSGQFVVDTESHGAVLFAQYATSEALHGGAWSVETGGFLWSSGPGRIMDVIQAGGAIFVAVNDTALQSGGIRQFGESHSTYLSDALAGEGLLNPTFTPQGLFEFGDYGFGFLAEGFVEGVRTNFVAEVRLVPPVSEPATFTFLVDQNDDGIIDFVHEGPAETEIPLHYDRSGIYRMMVQAMRNGKVVAEGATSVSVTPHLPGTVTMHRRVADVDDDGRVTPFDVLTLLGRLQSGEGDLPDEYFDVNRDGRISPFDVLMVVSAIRDATIAGPAPTWTVGLTNETGVTGTGLSSDLSLAGKVSPAAEKLIIAFQAVERDVSVALAADGVFSLAHDELEELFGPFLDNDLEFRFWTERGPSHAIALKLALE